MSDDVRLNSKARKAIVSCWFDIARIRMRVTRGKIYLQGTIVRLGEDPEDPDCNLPFLEKLDDALRNLAGFKAAFYGFDNWKQNKSGTWLFVGKRPKVKKPAKAGDAKAPEAPKDEHVAGEAAVADEALAEVDAPTKTDGTPVPL